MPIASAVVALDDRPELRAHALRILSDDRRVEVGDCSGDFFPIVLDTATADEGEALVEALLATPGVLWVDVVGVDFSADVDPAAHDGGDDVRDDERSGLRARAQEPSGGG